MLEWIDGVLPWALGALLVWAAYRAGFARGMITLAEMPKDEALRKVRDLKRGEEGW